MPGTLQELVHIAIVNCKKIFADHTKPQSEARMSKCGILGCSYTSFLQFEEVGYVLSSLYVECNGSSIIATGESPPQRSGCDLCHTRTSQ